MTGLPENSMGQRGADKRFQIAKSTPFSTSAKVFWQKETGALRRMVTGVDGKDLLFIECCLSKIC